MKWSKLDHRRKIINVPTPRNLHQAAFLSLYQGLHPLLRRLRIVDLCPCVSNTADNHDDPWNDHIQSHISASVLCLLPSTPTRELHCHEETSHRTLSEDGRIYLGRHVAVPKSYPWGFHESTRASL